MCYDGGMKLHTILVLIALLCFAVFMATLSRDVWQLGVPAMFGAIGFGIAALVVRTMRKSPA